LNYIFYSLICQIETKQKKSIRKGEQIFNLKGEIEKN